MQLTEAQQIEMASRLFSSPDWQLMRFLFEQYENSAIDGIRRGDTDIASAVAKIQVIGDLRQSIRSAAEPGGTDPFPE